jgi:ketosteroid isomerase-like protein
MQSSVLKLNGQGEVRKYLDDTTGEYTKLEVSLTDVRDQGGGRFVVVGSWRATPSHSATSFGTPVAAVFDVHDGKVARLRAFFDEQLAIAAARD